MNEQASTDGPSRGAVLIGMVITLIGGFFLGRFTSAGASEEGRFAAAREAKRVAVPVGTSPSLGPADAPVTVVEFADFQCGFCSRSVALQRRLRADFGENVRWVFKNFPLDFHPQAKPAAKAALAAHQQGRFWEFHDRLFASQRKLATADLEALAFELALDLPTFKRMFGGSVLDKLVEEDRALGHRAGVQGTPSFYINGRQVQGAMTYAHLKEVVAEELAFAAHLIAGGTPRAVLYEELTRARDEEGAQAGEGAKAGEGKPARPQEPAREGAIYRVWPREGAVLGEEQALATAIFFGDFECEKSARALRGLLKLQRELAGQLRLVFRHFPRESQPARLAAEAAQAARVQGKFWEYQARLFSQGKDLSREVLLRLGRELGLDAARLQEDLKTHRYARVVEEDVAEAKKLGLLGTPALFINGRHTSALQPVEELKRIIGEETRRAELELQRGTTREELYEVLIGRSASAAASASAPVAPALPAH